MARGKPRLVGVVGVLHNDKGILVVTLISMSDPNKAEISFTKKKKKKNQAEI